MALKWHKADWTEVSREANHDNVSGLDYDFVDYRLTNRVNRTTNLAQDFALKCRALR
jgi:hypothetical protein